MLVLSEPQAEVVMTAASGLPAEKRGLFVERVVARLRLNGTRFTAVDLARAFHLAAGSWVLDVPVKGGDKRYSVVRVEWPSYTGL
jgi:hypothetical protein